MAVSTKPRVVGVSCLKRATRVRSIVSTEICALIVASISVGSAAAPEIFEARRHDPVVGHLLLNQSERDRELAHRLDRVLGDDGIVERQVALDQRRDHLRGGWREAAAPDLGRSPRVLTQPVLSADDARSEEHTSELQSRFGTSY